jgi:MFS family permease
MQAGMTYLGLTAGPSLGGWVAATWGWRAVFYLNVPVGFLAIAVSLRFLPDDRPRSVREPFDVPGAMLFALGLGALLAALNQGHAWGWGSPHILAGFALAGVLLGVFLLVEHRVPAPMLDLTLFRRRTFSAAAASAVLNYVCVNSVIFLLPFYLIDGRGLSPARAGLLLTTTPIVMAIAAPLSGALSDRIGSRAPATLGMAIMSAGLVALSRLGPVTPLSQVVATLVLVGLANGLFSSPNNSALMGAAPRHRLGVASGVLACARNTGMVLGVGLAGAVFTTVLAHPLAGATAAPLFHAIQVAYLVAAGIALLGTVTSAVR